MTMIKILTDSTVQLSKEEQEQYQITVVPLSVMLENTIFYDGETINKTEFLQKMSESESLPKTSQPAIGRFVETFNEIGFDGSPIYSDLSS
ncbi:DegV family protein [Pisciglobus halotolerans]|uniref:EDD domain protein, DegV family n=1 Tax=Pisciglobus halotolerans TaxID=745365 RepID=A0A1I3BZD4_9LACT|nr:DegV family protein [Pisciglobus halotolerans]SFH67580.1 EDD domain protein, DegV family [Pisciglobus halotolerans]